jgi:hypothetical protein
MTRHNVPGGGWFDIEDDVSNLTEDHQNKYLDLGDELRAEKRKALAAAAAAAYPGAILDPDEEVPVELGRGEQQPIRDLVLSWVLTDSSYGKPLPHPLPLTAANVLRKAMAPVYLALNGVVPKENEPSGTTSASTSSDTAAAPPEASDPAPSVTPAG